VTEQVGVVITVDEIIDPRIIVKKKSNKRYINGVDFHNKLVWFYNKREKEPDIEIPLFIGLCLRHIATNLASKVNFSSYSFKEEMVGDAIVKMMEAVVEEKYDASISQNPFAYFTQITWNSFLQRIAKEKKESYIVHKNMDNMFVNEDLYTEDEDYRQINNILTEENHNKIIDSFEKPKEKNNYAGHKNLSYKPNREKKGRKKKELDITPESVL
jgi:hypothetical protein